MSVHPKSSMQIYFRFLFIFASSNVSSGIMQLIIVKLIKINCSSGCGLNFWPKKLQTPSKHNFVKRLQSFYWILVCLISGNVGFNLPKRQTLKIPHILRWTFFFMEILTFFMMLQQYLRLSQNTITKLWAFIWFIEITKIAK